MSEQSDEVFEALLVYLRDTRGFDFTGYQRMSLMRRVRHRMAQAGTATFEDYLGVLRAQPEEFAELFNTILVNVTAFFRDPGAWNAVRDDVIPRILASRRPGDPIRVWSAGGASGQEAYTVAILLAEALGEDAFRQRVKIYATDVDEEALAQARAASYDAGSVESVPKPLLDKYFQAVNGRFVVCKTLRHGVIVGRNDLVKDPPISRVDLLVCRNTLIYLDAATQRKVLTKLHFALAHYGTLFLGRAEMLLDHTDLFVPLDIDNRIFGTAPGRHLPDEPGEAPAVVPDRRDEIDGAESLRELAFRAGPVAQIVVTADDAVAMINRQAEAIFGLSGRDIGRPLGDLEISYRPVALRPCIEQVKVERRATCVQDVRWQQPGGEPAWFEVHLNPLLDNGDGLLGVSIAFFDVSASRALLDKLEAAYMDLQSTNEELETTNEELQSTVEELETTNEELQSTNEELQTVTEGLRSRRAGR